MSDQLIIIDPGIRNLAILIKSTIWLYHFKSLFELTSNVHFNSMLEEIGKSNSNIEILCENQLTRNNIQTQGFLCGYISGRIKIDRMHLYRARLRNYYFIKTFGCKYTKVRTKKQFARLPSTLLNRLRDWTVNEINGNFKNVLKFEQVKKKDDLIDCIIMQQSWTN